MTHISPVFKLRLQLRAYASVWTGNVQKKMWTSLTICLLLLSVSTLAETYSPRMVFTHEETAAKRIPLPGEHVPVQMVLGQMDNVISVGQTYLSFFNFQNPEKSPLEKKLVLKNCNNKVERNCNYNISVVYQTKGTDQVFVCGNNGQETECCYMNLTLHSPLCVSENVQNIKDSIGNFDIQEGEHSVLIEDQSESTLYITSSGARESAGIHKFGKARVRPENSLKEEYYVGLMLSRRDDPLQNKIYGFYKQKNGDTEHYSEMWLPFVSQVCTSDVGGPKNNLQSIWTSHLKARLYCGDDKKRHHFSELVDVATVDGDRWEDTKVYALFRNEWGMSAICMYSIKDIDHIFITSPIKGSTKENKIDRLRMCVPESTRLSSTDLMNVQRGSEMKDWVMPVNNSRPLLINHHIYTHIYVDAFQNKRNGLHTVFYLSLNDGRIHKVVHVRNQSFIIAEYTPFEQSTQILDFILHPSSRKLYVNTRSEVVQLDVGNCAHYGKTCEECILSRDPYCSWSNKGCSNETRNGEQDVTAGNPDLCSSLTSNWSEESLEELAVKVPSHSKFFLDCPVMSHHAKYTWNTPDGKSVECSYMGKDCILQIDNMSSTQAGSYKCVSDEKGYTKVQAQYSLQVRSTAAGRTFNPAVWVCAMAVLIKSFCS